MATSANPASISPMVGLICMCAWMVAFVGAAAITLVRRDV
jgi:hypothetical protein